LEVEMNRRNFMKKAGIAVAGASISPLMFANAQRSKFSFEMVTSWPTSLDTLYGGAESVARYIEEASSGDITVKVYPAGAQIGALEVYDAVSTGAFAMAHTAPYYFINKNPAHGFFTTVPFGMDSQQFNAWMYSGNGDALHQELLAPDDMVAFPSGNTGAQTGGWFKREVHTVADLQGLSMRFPGFGGQVMGRVGMNVQNIPGGELFLALDTGVVDAADWVGPYDDQILGLNKAAPYYYFPSWAEPGPGVCTYMNKSEFESLPTDLQAVVRDACARVNVEMLSNYDTKNYRALQELVASGTQIRLFSDEILKAFAEATEAIHAENAANNAAYQRILDDYRAFLDNVRAWTKITYNAFNEFIFQ
jgi:TRAP-type mannitol/chloroaromatic compound transport system substrate-binding protein